jgi:hypothetical protein
MFKRFLSTAFFVSLFCTSVAFAAQASAVVSEDTQTRLSKEEIIGLMTRMNRLPVSEQDGKLDLILKNQSGSKTPRSDFLFCMGLAYMGNSKAQKCVGNAYENGHGIVEDRSEAYAWFALAQEQNAADGSPDLERVKTRLVSTYPSPSDDDLDDLVRAQKSRITQYREESNKIQK